MAPPERVAYGRIGSPFGDLLAVATERGLARLAFPEEDHDRVLEDLAGELGVQPAGSPAGLDPIRRQIEGYFGGTRRAFDVQADLRTVHGFAHRVLEATARIPHGAVASYGSVAGWAGSPRGARAAGNALRLNPVPIVVPCHRVIHADGGLGGYGGREDRKAFLLDLEAAAGHRR